MKKVDGFLSDSVTSIYHLGLVAGVYDSLEIGPIVDQCIPKTRSHFLSHGNVLKAMILNGLGFTERRLYLFPEFFDDITVDRLLGEGITQEHINDDVLGKTLDAIYKAGPTQIFNEIVVKSLIKDEFTTKLLHVDTTNFSVYGKYDNDSPDTIEITKGYPKDGRWELNRFVLGMATNQMGIPVFLKSFSGNTQDKKSIVKMIGEIQKNLKFEDKIYYLADSALYTEANIQEISDHSFWISRAPNTITETQTLCMSNLSMTPCIDERYAHYVTESKYGDISQQWVVYQSFERLKSDQKKKAEELKNKLSEANSKLKKLMSNEFTSEDKALKAAEKWIQKKPMYQFTSCTTICKKKRKDGKRGRPRKDEVLIPVYFIKASIEEIAEQREKEMNKSGRFVLATNDMSIDPDTLLANYKNQIQVERGFRFLKDKSFLVSEVFLKKPERIEALAMIMVLCLFVYAVAEFRIRKRLKDANQTVLNQKRKPTQRPTMKWIFFKFRRVREITLVTENTVLKKVVMMKDELWKICRLLGPECEKYYVDQETCGI